MATNHPTNVWLHQITNKRIMITDGDLLMICYHHYNILQLWCLHVPCGCFSQRLRVLSAVSRDRNFCGVAVEPAPRITVYPGGTTGPLVCFPHGKTLENVGKSSINEGFTCFYHKKIHEKNGRFNGIDESSKWLISQPC